LEEVTLSEEQFVSFLQDIESFVGTEMEIMGQVLFIDKSTLHILINIDEVTFPVIAQGKKYSGEIGDFVRVEGLVDGKSDLQTEVLTEDVDENGTEIDGFNIPIIKAKSIDQISYKEAVAPTLETVDVNKSMEQDGLLISLDKIEFSKNET
ncbi:hypothetical protein, partial [Pseudomonas sp. 2822-17]|uniref:hypothetical protein n=1 Tax=Pseudomonas sp. 2822-17 TaxID=1712678 RepID=UPI000C432CF7